MTTFNKEQLQAITYDKGPLLVAAGPGSGKTAVITERVKFLLTKKKVKPTEILCLTFSEKGAREMKTRLEKMKIDTADIQISTYHSFCNKILHDFSMISGIGTGRLVSRASFLVWGLENIDSFGFDSWIEIKSNPAELIEKMIDGISTFKDELIEPDEIQKYVKKELAKVTKKTDAEIIQDLHNLDNLIKIYRKYDAYKRKQGVLDFDDLIVLTNQLLDDKSKKHVLNHLQNTYKHILVDEFQDNNFAQFSIVKKLVTKGHITAVGDDDQSIYRFQGSYPEIFADFMRSFKNSKMILLKKNYRNIPSVVDLSGQLLKQDQNRKRKPIVSTKKNKDRVLLTTCTSEFFQAEYVKDKILELKKKNKKLNYSDFAVLSRKQLDGMLIADMLTSTGIPVNYVGKSNIFNSPGARNLMSYLYVVADPENSGIYINRILEVHGVSVSDIKAINMEAQKRAWSKPGDCVFDVISDLIVFKYYKDKESKLQKMRVKLSNGTQIRSISSHLRNLLNISNEGTTAKTIHDVMRKYTDIFKNATREFTFENFIEVSVLLDLQNAATDLQVLKPNCTIKDFLHYVDALEKFEVETEQGSGLTNSVQVSTIHQSKGKEFAHVFIINAGERQIPLDFRQKLFYVPKGLAKGLYPATDPKTYFTNEERRLLYVGMTRAIDNLYISYVNQFSSGNERDLSKFLDDLDPQTNSNIKLAIKTGKHTKSSTIITNPVDILQKEALTIAIKNINTGQYESALQKLVDLNAIKQYKKKKTLKGIKLARGISLNPSPNLEKKLKGIKTKAIDISDLTLSATKLVTYDKCPKKFKYETIWKAGSNLPNPNMYRGSVFHDVVKQAGEAQEKGKIMTVKQLTDAYTAQWDITKFLDFGKTKESQERGNMKKMLGVYKKWIDQSRNKVVAIEQPFGLKIKGILIKGKIDRVEVTPTGDLWVVDYKTGTWPPKSLKKDIQLTVYSLACQKLYGKLPARAMLFYPMNDTNNKKKKRFYDFSVTPAIFKTSMKEIEGLVDRIKNLDFDATPGGGRYGVCGMCDFRTICEDAK